MHLRIILGGCIAGYLVLGTARSASGQVWLEAPVLEVSQNDDRYGGYEPTHEADDLPEFPLNAPRLIAQGDEWLQPPGQTLAEPLPPSETPPASVPSLREPYVSPLPSPPVMSRPVTIYPEGSSYFVSTPYAGYAQPLMPMPRRSCPPWRPCGPQESFGGNWLISQGFFGADFRPACASHDACLMSGCYSRKACDRMFLSNLDAACNCSQFPFLCRLKARKCYLGVRLFGWLY